MDIDPWFGLSGRREGNILWLSTKSFSPEIFMSKTRLTCAETFADRAQATERRIVLVVSFMIVYPQRRLWNTDCVVEKWCDTGIYGYETRREFAYERIIVGIQTSKHSAHVENRGALEHI